MQPLSTSAQQVGAWGVNTWDPSKRWHLSLANPARSQRAWPHTVLPEHGAPQTRFLHLPNGFELLDMVVGRTVGQSSQMASESFVAHSRPVIMGAL